MSLIQELRERAESYRLGGPSSEHTALLLKAAAAKIEYLEALIEEESEPAKTNRTSLECKLLEALIAALEWIDAVPDETAQSLPAMPGFDRDEVDALIAYARPAPPSPTPKGRMDELREARPQARHT